MGQFSDWVDLVGHMAWPGTVLVLCFLAKKQIRQMVESLAARIADHNSHVKIDKTGIEIKAIERANPELKNIEVILPKAITYEANPNDGLSQSFAAERSTKRIDVCVLYMCWSQLMIALNNSISLSISYRTKKAHCRTSKRQSLSLVITGVIASFSDAKLVMSLVSELLRTGRSFALAVLRLATARRSLSTATSILKWASW